MNSRDFIYWLQGFFELANPSTIGEVEIDLIKRHLHLVFKHEIDPSYGDEDHQYTLNEIHNFPSNQEIFMNKPNDFNQIMKC